jgi:hypothetical protein
MYCIIFMASHLNFLNFIQVRNTGKFSVTCRYTFLVIFCTLNTTRETELKLSHFLSRQHTVKCVGGVKWKFNSTHSLPLRYVDVCGHIYIPVFYRWEKSIWCAGWNPELFWSLERREKSLALAEKRVVPFICRTVRSPFTMPKRKNCDSRPTLC